MEGDSRGGDWRPFLFFGRVSFSKESGNCVDWNSLILVGASPWEPSGDKEHENAITGTCCGDGCTVVIVPRRCAWARGVRAESESARGTRSVEGWAAAGADAKTRD